MNVKSRLTPSLALRVSVIAVALALAAGCREPVVPPAAASAPRAERAPTEPAAKTPETSAAEPNADPDANPPQRAAKERPASIRPRADRTAADGVEKITFDDLILGMDADMVFRPWMLEANDGRAKELEGKRVRLPGIMFVTESLTKNKEFALLRNKECLFGKGGQADHIAWVKMKEGMTAALTSKSVFVEGVLRITPYTGTDGNTWYIYTLEDAELK